MIQVTDKRYVLSTKNTTYAFEVTQSGHLEHLYYGRRIQLLSAAHLRRKAEFPPCNANPYSSDFPGFGLENQCLEMSSYGKGDIWEPFIEVTHADGSSTSDFRFDQANILDEKAEFETLPGSYTERGNAEHLQIRLVDAAYRLALELHYYVYEDCDVICRSAKLINEGEASVTVNRLMSSQLDFPRQKFVVTTFQGAWAREMGRVDVSLNGGLFVNASATGTSSNRANPFVILSEKYTTEDAGECYGCNLIYSGNHYEAFQTTSYGNTRVVIGMNPAFFAWKLAPGESLEAPEAVHTYARAGYRQMSQQMHQFVREHIVRGQWKYKNRPVLLNSWEASYFDITEASLLKLAKAGKEAGVELFVMDDGWFGKRNDDTSSLGDWEPDQVKLPGGVSGLCEKVKALGLEFGIWVEPEMVNTDSNFYRKHPDWTIEIPGKPHSEGRNQRILDLTNPNVVDAQIEAMSRVFSSADISYVKWDMNRTFTDYYSQSLPPKKQGEVAHRYVQGLYRMLKVLTERFPQILFEGCSSGGNRFDLGILCYCPQIWGSDNTDAYCRAQIQNGYSYGYPMSTVSAHVSTCPNHQTVRTIPLDTRFHVAAFGVFGLECNLTELEPEELERIKEQISLYKQWRDTLQWGDFYRGQSFEEGNLVQWTCVSKDQSKAVGMMMQSLVTPNLTDVIYWPKGLKETTQYHFYNIPAKHNIPLSHNGSKAAMTNGETEDYTGYGDALMYGGVHLKQGYVGTAANDQMRYFPDFASRMYFMKACRGE